MATLSTVEGQMEKSSSTNATRLGRLDGISGDTLIIRNPEINPQSTGAVEGSFVMFSKDKTANNTSLVGYYADVKLVNDSIEDAELFMLASEITVSSK